MDEKEKTRLGSGTDENLRNYFDELLNANAVDESLPTDYTPDPSLGSNAATAENTRIQIFVLHGLNLGVADYDIAAVVAWNEPRAETHGVWFSNLGSYAFAGSSIPIVDISQLVLPPAMLQQTQRQQHRQEFTHLIVLKAGLALACHGLGETMDVARTEVCWRTARTSRPWLAGTVERLSCALLEIRGLVDAL